MVGCGACAVVQYVKGRDEEYSCTVKEDGCNVSSERCEIEGIILSLETVIQSISEGHGQGHNERVHILCDCQRAIDVFTVHSQFRNHPEIWERVLLICDKLVESSCEVKLVKIPGHSNIIGNDIADHKAKEVASEIKRGLRGAPNGISIFDARKVCTDIVKKSWQRKWDEDNKGRRTYEYIPVVGKKVLWPRKRDIGISYGGILLHDTRLKHDSYRTRTAESPVCECGEDEESVPHIYGGPLRSSRRFISHSTCARQPCLRAHVEFYCTRLARKRLFTPTKRDFGGLLTP